MIIARYYYFRPTFKPIDKYGYQDWHAAFNGNIREKEIIQYITCGNCCISIEEKYAQNAVEYLQSIGWELTGQSGRLYGYSLSDFYIGQVIRENEQIKQVVDFGEYAQYKTIIVEYKPLCKRKPLRHHIWILEKVFKGTDIKTVTPHYRHVLHKEEISHIPVQSGLLLSRNSKFFKGDGKR